MKKLKRKAALARYKASHRTGRRSRNQVVLSPIFQLVLINVGISKANAKEVRDRLALHILRLTGNASFPSPTPTLLVLQGLHDTLDTLITEAKDSKMARGQRDAKAKLGRAAISQLAAYVWLTCDGDQLKIESAGFVVRKEPTPAHVPVQVKGLEATAEKTSGKISLKWTSLLDDSIRYIVQRKKNYNDPEWENLGLSTKANWEVTGCEPGHVYFFRIIAINGKGAGPESDICEQRSL